MTNANYVTPFCFEEHRNKRRVIKYARRGFKPFLVDPHDNGPCQNVACDARITRKAFMPKSVHYYEHTDYNIKAEIAAVQEAKMDELKQDRMYCCHVHGADTLIQNEDQFRTLGCDSRKLRRHLGRAIYTMKMFEKSPGDALDFFQERFGWSDDDLRIVNEVDPYLRVACQKCRNEYNLVRVVMPKYPDLMKEYDLEDDNLRGKFSYTHTNGEQCFVSYDPSFYSGGVFDGALVRGDARRTVQILSMLHAQSIFEVSAYVMKHGSPDNYKKRFVHGSILTKTLQKAGRTPLRKAARPPIGLNPERFVERCEQCRSWLLGNRYGSKDCQRCSGNKK